MVVVGWSRPASHITSDTLIVVIHDEGCDAVLMFSAMVIASIMRSWPESQGKQCPITNHHTSWEIMIFLHAGGDLLPFSFIWPSYYPVSKASNGLYHSLYMMIVGSVTNVIRRT